MANKPTTIGGLGTALWNPPIAMTASYQLTPGDVGGFFTNRGAGGAIIFTLPAIADVPAGASFEFYVVADQDLTVGGVAGSLFTKNDVAANSVKYGTTSEKLGGYFRIRSDGTSWLVAEGLAGQGAQTVTVAT
jgi:hypothetical protein